MRRSFLLLSLLTSGCWLGSGQPFDHAVTTCRVSCPGGHFTNEIEVVSEFIISCDVAEANIALGRQILNDRGIVPESKFCANFANVPIYVRNLPNWDHEDNTVKTGEYDYWTHSMQLNFNGTAMVHEWLHHYQNHHSLLGFDPGTSSHSGWKEMGWFDADDEFSEAILHRQRGAAPFCGDACNP